MASKAERTIAGAVRLNGRTYIKGQEDAFARVLPKKDVERLHKKGVLKGDWGVAEEPAPDTSASLEKETSSDATTGASTAGAETLETVETPETPAARETAVAPTPAPAKPAKRAPRKSGAKKSAKRAGKEK